MKNQHNDSRSVIQNLVRNYNAGDVETTLKCYAEDAVVDILPRGAIPSEKEAPYRGKEAIRGWLEGAAAQNAQVEVIQDDVDGNAVTARIRVQSDLLKQTGIGPLTGTDHFVVEHGKIASHTFRFSEEAVDRLRSAQSGEAMNRQPTRDTRREPRDVVPNPTTEDAMTQAHQPIVSAVGDGKTYWTGFPNIIRITGEQTGGAFTLIELRIPPGFSGPPHIHRNEHQTDHVVEGELVYTVGDETIVAKAGTVVHCPKDVPHTFSNQSDEEAVAYDWLHPAGFDEFMRRAAPLLSDPDDPPELDMDRVIKLAPEYGIEFLPPEAHQESVTDER